ncbi:MAG TPA: trimethylamine corrinoid protein 2, partial [Planctomycetota bacterium]|nr:trimethylamine corrinoid protein 2 [Planctomycetota bacterium]
GGTSWLPCWGEGKYATIQCDFNALIGPDMYKEFFLPELEAEANYLDHCVYHLDGPDTLCHLDNLLAIRKIDAIEWVPGSGQPSHIHWLDVLRRIQNAGKGVWMDVPADEAKLLAKELRPEHTFYNITGGISTEKEARDLIEWFKANT